MAVEAATEETAASETAPEVSTPVTEQTPAGASGDNATASTETAAETAPAEPDYFDFFHKKGGVDFRDKYKTPDELAKGVANLVQLAGRKSEKELQAEQIIAWHHQQAALAQQAQRQPPAADPNASRPFWNPPEVKQTDKRWIEPDPENQGATRIKPNTPLDVRQRLEAFINYRDEYGYKLEHAPHELYQEIEQRAVDKATERAFQQMQQYLQQQQAQQEFQNTAQRILSERTAMVHQMTPDGQLVVDGSGQYVLTPYGQAYATTMLRLNQQGITDPGLRDSLAHEIAAAKATQGLSKPAPTKTPGASKANGATGGKVNGSERTHGKKGNSLAARILAENPDLKDGDDVVSIVMTD